MTNPFAGIINSEFKKIYNNAIDSLLENNALTVPCLFKYTGAGSNIYCNNCIFDSISQLSSNKYNGTGPSSFPEGSLCPVCMGMGKTAAQSSLETIYLACIFDSKYWLKLSSNILNIPDGMVQTICKIETLPKIRKVTEIVIDTNINKYGNYSYERFGDPEPAGFGSNNYIITMWKRK